jgi:outer membrane protein OmpA-like peptidoglycan-associated protein
VFIKNPKRNENGFENINQRKEYKYYGHENEKIWHEFGRPFWRGEAKRKTVKAPTPKKVKMIQQTATEKRASTLRSISKNYDAKKKTLTLDVKFELNKADIQTDYTTAIDKLGLALKEDKDLSIEIQGHTDTTGPRSLNMALSDNRAQSVKEYLMKKYEISEDRLTSKGLGPTQPIATNETRDGRKKNRRVDIKVIQ